MAEHETGDWGSSYRAFLVRMWQDTPGAPWRASAQSVHTGEVIRFATLPALLHFLRAHTSLPEPTAWSCVEDPNSG